MSKESQDIDSTKQLGENARSVVKEISKGARKKLIKKLKKRLKATPPPPRYERKIEQGTSMGRLSLEADNLIGLLGACGTTDHKFAEALVRDVRHAACHVQPEDAADALNAALVALSSLAPTDETEAMLAAQMFATHKAAMSMLGLAIREETLPVAQWRSSFAVKLLRTYTLQMEVLQRYRSKGQQKVTVEHVHVHAGGQAIVGSVTGGGGGQRKTEEQPHAIESQPTITMPAMPCSNAEGELMHVSGNAERQMPDARRPIHRRAKGQ